MTGLLWDIKMADLVIYLPNHGYSDSDEVTASWLTGTYYIYDRDQDSFKLSETRGPTRYIEQMQSRVSVDLADSHFVDSGLAFDGLSAIIIDITNADPGVVTTLVAHGLSDSDQVYISGVEGMPEVNGNYYTIGNVTSTTFELRDYTGGA